MGIKSFAIIILQRMDMIYEMEFMVSHKNTRKIETENLMIIVSEEIWNRLQVD